MRRKLIRFGVALIAILVFVILVSGQAKAQTKIWSQVISPGDGIETTTVSPTGDIYCLMTSNQCAVSNNLGVSWSYYPVTFNVECVSQNDAVWFNGYLYAVCDGGIIRSSNGINWEQVWSGFYGPLCATSQYLFAFGTNAASWRTDGTNWTAITSPQATVSAACAGICNQCPGTNAVVVICPSGQMQSIAFESYDNGLTWVQNAQMDIQALQAAINPNQSGAYTVVGTASSFQLSSRGEYDYNYLHGNQNVVTYSIGDCLAGGYASLNGQTTAVIVTNGDLSSAAYLDDNEVVILTSNDLVIIKDKETLNSGQDLAVAVTESSAMYLWQTATGINPLIAKNTSAVYPNPVDDLTILETSVGGIYGLYDYTGRLLRSSPVQAGKNTLNFSTLSPGVYILEVNSESIKVVKK